MPRMVTVAYTLRWTGKLWAITKWRGVGQWAIISYEHHMFIGEKVENTKKQNDKKEILVTHDLLDNHY